MFFRDVYFGPEFIDKIWMYVNLIWIYGSAHGCIEIFGKIYGFNLTKLILLESRL